MKVNSIYTAARKLLAERCGSCTDHDFADRAPYIASAIIAEAEALDREYRRVHALPAGTYPGGAAVPLNAEFPLADRFAPAAAYFMAAMLILDDDPDEYEKLFDLWCGALASIAAELPGCPGKTADVYPIW